VRLAHLIAFVVVLAGRTVKSFDGFAFKGFFDVNVWVVLLTFTVSVIIQLLFYGETRYALDRLLVWVHMNCRQSWAYAITTTNALMIGSISETDWFATLNIQLSKGFRSPTHCLICSQTGWLQAITKTSTFILLWRSSFKTTIWNVSIRCIVFSHTTDKIAILSWIECSTDNVYRLTACRPCTVPWLILAHTVSQKICIAIILRFLMQIFVRGSIRVVGIVFIRFIVAALVVRTWIFI